MPQTEMRFEILEDGTISCETDGIAGVHHVSADELLRWVARKAGGDRVTTKRRHGHVRQNQAGLIRLND